MYPMQPRSMERVAVCDYVPTGRGYPVMTYPVKVLGEAWPCHVRRPLPQQQVDGAVVRPLSGVLSKQHSAFRNHARDEGICLNAIQLKCMFRCLNDVFKTL